MAERLRILLLGNGGREHALAWKLSQSPRVEWISVVPGNGGTAEGLRNVYNKEDIKPDDYESMVAFAKKTNVNLVVPGPEAPLVDGIEAYFRAAGIRCFGPSKAAARMEGSKTFSKDFMRRNKIPTAEYRNFDEYDAAREYLDSVTHSVVIKASGLAAGKGVLIPSSKEEAHAALKDVMLEKEFGAAGDEVVIEEFLEGDELSILAFSDGYTIRALPPAQDHKRIHDGDQGPNTGGMGCYAPTKIASKATLEQIQKTILQPTIDGMRREAFPFVGMLFSGLMMTKTGPKVLEYNVRFGDPETQTILPLLSPDTDLAEIMVACTEHWLDGVEILIEPKFGATVVVAAGGYPGSYKKGINMTLDAVDDDIKIFHAGTTKADNQLKTSGGRVIAASATADSLEDAVSRAYEGIKSIHFEGMYYRKDIAHRAFEAPPSREAMTYASAGVSIDAGNALVENIKSAVRSTRRPGADAEIGGFGGTFDLAGAGYTDLPILIGAIDGVGTKLKIAHAMDKHDTVGIDLVAMSINDLLAQGAHPLFFLDCFSCSTLSPRTAASFIAGVAAGCRASGCALIGGETAEMPGLYAGTDYDAVGAAVGAVPSPHHLLPALAAMRPGDALVALASDGLHSNGFSLVRAILAREGLAYTQPAPWAEAASAVSVGDSLLTPTRIYARALLPLLARTDDAGARSQPLIKGLAHITGGGLPENVPRMLPGHLAARIDLGSWDVPSVFRWVKRVGGVAAGEMLRALNCGVGMVLVVDGGEGMVEEVLGALEGTGERAWVLGRVVERGEGEEVVFEGLEGWGGE
ncbi:MAG: hypothetical protein M1833_001463 [Piccolia ochrophora]|nr:MAG: hypothetical protein M1833_001463 [Piccolia ochrophora]